MTIPAAQLVVLRAVRRPASASMVLAASGAVTFLAVTLSMIGGLVLAGPVGLLVGWVVSLPLRLLLHGGVALAGRLVVDSQAPAIMQPRAEPREHFGN